MLDIKDVKKARVSLGLTQTQLAREAGVSQSVVAKIESGSIDPSYTTAQRIFSALEQRRTSNSPKAIDIMHTSILSIRPSDLVSVAVKLMREHAVSQLPVLEDAKIVGIVSESTVLANMQNLNQKVADIMEAAPPTVPPHADLQVVSSLLQHYPLVLVVEKGVLAGIVTKSDIIGALV